MTDKDLLLSISNLMDKKLQPIQNQIVAVEERLNTKVESIKGELKSLKSDIHKINVHLECNIEPRLQNIENCYMSTYERYKDSTEKIESMELDISVMKDVILEHSKQLKMIS